MTSASAAARSSPSDNRGCGEAGRQSPRSGGARPGSARVESADPKAEIGSRWSSGPGSRENPGQLDHGSPCGQAPANQVMCRGEDRRLLARTPAAQEQHARQETSNPASTAAKPSSHPVAAGRVITPASIARAFPSAVRFSRSRWVPPKIRQDQGISSRTRRMSAMACPSDSRALCTSRGCRRFGEKLRRRPDQPGFRARFGVCVRGWERQYEQPDSSLGDLAGQGGKIGRACARRIGEVTTIGHDQE